MSTEGPARGHSHTLPQQHTDNETAAHSSRDRRRPFRSIAAEAKGRLPWLLDDWLVGFRHPVKVLASAVFMVFVSVFPALTFGNELAHRTHLEYGVVEVLLSTAACGALFACVSGQPLVVVGVTGPITAFAAATHHMCKSFHYPFLPTMFWVCLWAAVMHWALATWNFCDDLVKYVTRFSCEIFGVLIAIIYLVSGIDGVVRRYEGPNPEQMSVFLLVTLNTLVVAVLSVTLGEAQNWWLFTPKIRFYIADWGVSLSVIFMWILVSSTPPWYHVRMRQLSIPPAFGPTRPRPWLIRPLDAPPAAILFALVPATILTILIYFDHNVSSLLAQSPHLALKKPPAYNLDFLVVGASLIFCGALGLPPTHGLIPQAILHVESLVYEKHTPGGEGATGRKPWQRWACSRNPWSSFWQAWLPVHKEGEAVGPGGMGPPSPAVSLPQGADLDAAQLHAVVSVNGNGVHVPSPPPAEKYVVETRLSGLLQSILIGLTLCNPILTHIKKMPPSLLYGTFIYMGIASFKSNQFFARFLAITLTEPPHRLKRYLAAHISPLITHLPTRRIARYTALQFSCLVIVVVVTIAGGPASISFPVLIIMLIPLRHRFFPRFFSPQELLILDSWSPPDCLAVVSTGQGPGVASGNGSSGADGCINPVTDPSGSSSSRNASRP